MSSIAWGTPSGRGVIAAAALGSGLTLLDGTVVNVALRTMGDDLDAFLRETRAKNYSSRGAPQIVLFSPIANG